MGSKVIIFSAVLVLMSFTNVHGSRPRRSAERKFQILYINKIILFRIVENLIIYIIKNYYSLSFFFYYLESK